MTSPLALTGHLAQRQSRWLWLLKMFAVIPHVVLLVGLWLVFVVVTFVAGIAILVTGRYPRSLFTLTTGIIRWNWRVGFYSWAALGTDRYPPFRLGSADYPATLDVTYPERLSRGLVLVKWLLAVPHVIVVALIASDIMLYPIAALNDLAGDMRIIAGGYSVLNLLVVIAGFFLLITGRHPVSLFDFLMGINRWMHRVLIYVALMTDDYPPFRLDAGATEEVQS